MTDPAAPPTCTAIRPTETMHGVIQVHCTRTAGHPDGHLGYSGAFPVRWTTDQVAR